MEIRADIETAALAFLSQHAAEAYFVSELTVGVRATGASEADLLAAVENLRDREAVCMQTYHWSDPHLPLDGFQIVSVVDAALPARQGQDEAFGRIEAHWSRWLRQFLATHRCS